MTDAKKYQCDHSPNANTMHHCTIICEGCLRKIVNQRLRLLEFLKKWAKHPHSEMPIEAEQLLKEIGEL